MRLHYFQHASFESPGTILEWAAANQCIVTHTPFFDASYTVPDLNNIDALIIMGGPMNVDEEEKYPWLQAEKLLIQEAIAKGKKVLGICLGAQLIISALGGKVFANDVKEIGFFPVSIIKHASNTLFSAYMDSSVLFHWHGDSFDLLPSMQLLASTAACTNQAFAMNHNVLGIQFHPEVNEAVIDNMIAHEGNELTENGSFIQPPEEIRSHYPMLVDIKAPFFQLLSTFFYGV